MCSETCRGSDFMYILWVNEQDLSENARYGPLRGNNVLYSVIKFPSPVLLCSYTCLSLPLCHKYVTKNTNINSGLAFCWRSRR